MSEENRTESLENALSALAEQQEKLLKQQESLLEQISAQKTAARKDLWDRISAIAPILSGTIIAIGGAYFTVAYNQQQLKLQEVQTIEKFIPHLLGDEKSKRAAILAISSLTNDKLAARVASIFASPGTVSALESIADQSGDSKALKNSLAHALDNMAESYRMDKRYEEAIAAYRKALALQEQTVGPQSPELIMGLNRLAELSAIHKSFDDAESYLKRATDLEKQHSGADSMQYAAQLRRLASLYREEGLDSKSQSLMNQAVAIEQKLPGTAGGSAIGATIIEEKKTVAAQDTTARDLHSSEEPTGEAGSAQIPAGGGNSGTQAAAPNPAPANNSQTNRESSEPASEAHPSTSTYLIKNNLEMSASKQVKKERTLQNDGMAAEAADEESR